MVDYEFHNGKLAIESTPDANEHFTTIVTFINCFRE